LASALRSSPHGSLFNTSARFFTTLTNNPQASQMALEKLYEYQDKFEKEPKNVKRAFKYLRVKTISLFCSGTQQE
jgi:hypothetical protein